MLIPTKQDKQYNTHNTYVQSIVITMTPIGYGSWDTQDEMKQVIYVCTRYPSQSFTKQTISRYSNLVSHLFNNQLPKYTFSNNVCSGSV